MFVTKSSLIIFLVVITIIQYGFAPETSGSDDEYEEAESRWLGEPRFEEDEESDFIPLNIQPRLVADKEQEARWPEDFIPFDIQPRLVGDVRFEEQARLAEEAKLVQVCEEMMTGRWYDVNSADGLLSFRKSYEHLTYELIYKEFDPPVGDESRDDKQTRLLKRELFTRYFMELASRTGIDFTEYPIQTLTQWCKFMARSAEGTCASAIIQLFQIDDSTSPYAIFTQFYEDWNVQKLDEKHEIKTSSATPVLNYPLAFFEYYKQRTIHPQYFKYGTFQSIHGFCVETGKIYVRNKESLRGYVFGELQFDD